MQDCEGGRLHKLLSVGTTVGAIKKFPFRITTVKRLPPYRDSIVA